MKMNLFDKFLLALLLLLLLVLSLFIGCIAAGFVPLSSVTFYLESLTGLWSTNGLIFGAVALVLFLVVIRLFYASYSGDGSQGYTRLSVTDNGEISISIPTIKQITSAYLATKPEVVASSSVIYPAKTGLVVDIRVCIKEGVILPEVTSGIQKELKAHLETVTGLTIKKVALHIDNNKSGYSGKVR